MITHASTLKNLKMMDEDTEKETLSYPVGGNANEKVSCGKSVWSNIHNEKCQNSYSAILLLKLYRTRPTPARARVFGFVRAQAAKDLLEL